MRRSRCAASTSSGPRNGTAQLDKDLARLRGLMGDRYDQIRDALPDLLERYGHLRDPMSLRRALVAWREQADDAGSPPAS